MAWVFLMPVSGKVLAMNKMKAKGGDRLYEIATEFKSDELFFYNYFFGLDAIIRDSAQK